VVAARAQASRPVIQAAAAHSQKAKSKKIGFHEKKTVLSTYDVLYTF
jgi:hypothetical protein